MHYICMAIETHTASRFNTVADTTRTGLSYSLFFFGQQCHCHDVNRGAQRHITNYGSASVLFLLLFPFIKKSPFICGVNVLFFIFVRGFRGINAYFKNVYALFLLKQTNAFHKCNPRLKKLGNLCTTQAG
eukprot:GEMP01032533.1.p2 GENE.GEMP01032533.1~~GEMP01032533.1.p2  ORF type:complete len:130 (+),score=3.69 GEMP01032533.1:1227-1616(+)